MKLRRNLMQSLHSCFHAMSASTLVSGVSGPFPEEAVATRTRTSGLFVYMCQSTRGGGGGWSPRGVPCVLWLSWGTGIHEWSRHLISVRCYTWVGPIGMPLSTIIIITITIIYAKFPPNRQCLKYALFFPLSKFYSG